MTPPPHEATDIILYRFIFGISKLIWSVSSAIGYSLLRKLDHRGRSAFTQDTLPSASDASGATHNRETLEP